MAATTSYRNAYALLAVLAGIPSFFAWFREPFVITRHEFDFSLGWLASGTGLTPLVWVKVGYLVHLLLLSGLGWMFYRIIMAETRENTPLTPREYLRWAVMAVPFLGYLPWLSPDVFCYLGIGWIQSAHGMDPYTQMNFQAPDFPGHPIYGNILSPWNYVITPYGPLFLRFMDWVTAWGHGNERVCLLILKAAFLGLHLLNAWLAVLIARHLGMKTRATALFFLLHPALLFCYVGRLQNDILLASCLMAGILFLLRNRPWLAMACFAAGSGFKYVPILMLPCFLVYTMRGDWRPASILRTAGLAAFFAALCFLPHLLFEGGPAGFWQMLTSKNQLQVNLVHWFLGGMLSQLGIMDFPVFNRLTHGLFFLVYAWLGIGLVRKGADIRPGDLFQTLFLMFLGYFILTSTRIHEWYAGWFIVCLFGINRLDYFRAGLVLCLGLQSLPILHGLRSVPLNLTGWLLVFLLVCACLRYLCRPEAARDTRPSPLFETRAGTTPPASQAPLHSTP